MFQIGKGDSETHCKRIVVGNCMQKLITRQKRARVSSGLPSKRVKISMLLYPKSWNTLNSHCSVMLTCKFQNKDTLFTKRERGGGEKDGGGGREREREREDTPTKDPHSFVCLSSFNPLTPKSD